MSNVDTRALAFKDRLTRLEEERRNLADDVKDLAKEMAGVGLSKDEIAGIKLAVRRSFETDEKRAKRITVEEFAESLGSMRDLPLGMAAVDNYGRN